MMPRNDTKASKYLSYILRHNPEKAGIKLDDRGYTEVDKLLKTLQEDGWSEFTKADLDRIVETNNKKRFAYSEDGFYIRASQGHSILVNLELQPVKPPQLLFHGTVKKFIKDISKSKLWPCALLVIIFIYLLTGSG
jgi:putative RNA 2'-phosphotransferase